MKSVASPFDYVQGRVVAALRLGRGAEAAAVPQKQGQRRDRRERIAMKHYAGCGISATSNSKFADDVTLQEAFQLTHPRLVECAKFLPATKSANHFMFNPRSLCSGEPFVRSDRAESLIVLYLRKIEYCVFKVVRQFCIE